MKNQSLLISILVAFLISIMLLSIILIKGCSNKEQKSSTDPLKKPFVIIYKSNGISSEGRGLMYYKYQDSIGYTKGFFDKDIYSIGDTIK